MGAEHLGEPGGDARRVVAQNLVLIEDLVAGNSQRCELAPDPEERGAVHDDVGGAVDQLDQSQVDNPFQDVGSELDGR